MQELLKFTKHAHRRLQQRGISPDQVRRTLEYGRKTYQPQQRVAYFVGDNEVEAATENGLDLRDCRNVAVIMGPDGAIVSVIRSNDYHRIKTYRANRRRRQRKRALRRRAGAFA